MPFQRLRKTFSRNTSPSDVEPKRSGFSFLRRRSNEEMIYSPNEEESQSSQSYTDRVRLMNKQDNSINLPLVTEQSNPVITEQSNFSLNITGEVTTVVSNSSVIPESSQVSSNTIDMPEELARIDIIENTGLPEKPKKDEVKNTLTMSNEGEKLMTLDTTSKLDKGKNARNMSDLIEYPQAASLDIPTSKSNLEQDNLTSHFVVENPQFHTDNDNASVCSDKTVFLECFTAELLNVPNEKEDVKEDIILPPAQSTNHSSPINNSLIKQHNQFQIIEDEYIQFGPKNHLNFQPKQSYTNTVIPLPLEGYHKTSPFLITIEKLKKEIDLSSQIISKQARKIAELQIERNKIAEDYENEMMGLISLRNMLQNHIANLENDVKTLTNSRCAECAARLTYYLSSGENVVNSEEDHFSKKLLSSIVCVACCENERCMVAIPCMHFVLCEECVNSLSELSREKACVICRNHISRYEKVYR